METIRGIPNKYLAAACLIMTFLLFWAGGTAFNQSPFYGALFIIIAMVLFFVGVHFGKKGPDIE
jgi:4-hydroxybenzoate polyprenyltransferase